MRIDPDLSLSTSIISKPRIIVRSKKTEAWRLGRDPCRGRSWSSSSSYFWKSLDHRTRPSSWWGGAPDDHGPPAAPFMGAPPFVTLSNPQPRKLKEKENNIYIDSPHLESHHDFDSLPLCTLIESSGYRSSHLPREEGVPGRWPLFIPAGIKDAEFARFSGRR